MITEYEMYVQLDHYHQHLHHQDDDEGSAFQLDHRHPITCSTPIAPVQSGHEFSRNRVADLISEPDRLLSVRQSSHASRGSAVRSTDSSSPAGKIGNRKRVSQQRQQDVDVVSKRRTRQNFSSTQTKALEQSFDLVTHYPDFNSMDELSKRLNLPVERIQVWFQNRRAKFRRNTAAAASAGTASLR